MSSVPKKADNLNLSLWSWQTDWCNTFKCRESSEDKQQYLIMLCDQEKAAQNQ